MARLAVVLLRVSAGRGDAAADVAARRAEVERDPVGALAQTLLTDALARPQDVNVGDMSARRRHETLDAEPRFGAARLR